MKHIKAIETQYKGYRFRSRLEARWAVFFDAMGIEWQYEPEGYDLGVLGWYLPDFFLPASNIWIEVKPSGTKIDEAAMAKIGAMFDDETMTRDEATCGALVEGLPHEQKISMYLFDSTDSSAGFQWWGYRDYKGDVASHDQVHFVLIDDGDALSFVASGGSREFIGGKVITHNELDMMTHFHFPTIESAGDIAKSVRFEHGEPQDIYCLQAYSPNDFLFIIEGEKNAKILKSLGIERLSIIGINEGAEKIPWNASNVISYLKRYKPWDSGNNLFVWGETGNRSHWRSIALNVGAGLIYFPHGAKPRSIMEMHDIGPDFLRGFVQHALEISCLSD